jgi:outer membrane protein assembly factor BamE (lipoprotein component of BamABCDE complex)
MVFRRPSPQFTAPIGLPVHHPAGRDDFGPIPVALHFQLRLDGVAAGLGAHFMRVVIVVVLGTTLAGCAIQRAQVAQDARAQMVGMSKEQVLTCMGPPGTKAAEGATEVWSYASGDGHTQTFGTATANTTAEATVSAIRSMEARTPLALPVRFQRAAFVRSTSS